MYACMYYFLAASFKFPSAKKVHITRYIFAFSGLEQPRRFTVLYMIYKLSLILTTKYTSRIVLNPTVLLEVSDPTTIS